MSTVAALLAEKHSNKIKRQQDHYQGKKGQEEWDRREKALNDQRTFLKHFRDVQFPTYKERTRLEALGNQYFRPFVEYFHEGLLRKVFVKSGGWKKLQEIERSREECYGEIPTALSNMEILDDEEEMGDHEEGMDESEEYCQGDKEEEEKNVEIKTIEELDVHLDSCIEDVPQEAEAKISHIAESKFVIDSKNGTEVGGTLTEEQGQKIGRFKGAEEAAKKLQEDKIVENMNQIYEKIAEQKVIDDLTEAASKGKKLDVVSISSMFDNSSSTQNSVIEIEDGDEFDNLAIEGADIPTIDPVWKWIGFKEEDPLKNFAESHGAAELVLECIVYLLETHTEEFRTIIKLRARRNDLDATTYPWFTTMKKIVYRICILFEIVDVEGKPYESRRTRKPYWPLIIEKNALMRLFVCGAIIFDYCFDNRVDDFTEVEPIMDETIDRIEKLMIEMKTIAQIENVAFGNKYGFFSSPEGSPVK